MYPVGGTVWGDLEAGAVLEEVCCCGVKAWRLKASCHFQFALSVVQGVCVFSFLLLLLGAMSAACCPAHTKIESYPSGAEAQIRSIFF